MTRGRKAASLGMYLVAANAASAAAGDDGISRVAWIVVSAVALWQGTLWIAKGGAVK